MRKFIKNVVLFAVLLATALPLPFVAVFFLVNVEAGDTMLGELNYKIERLASTPSPKIVFIGGSGCSHGIDSGMIERAFGLPVVNMGLSAALRIKYQLSSIDPYIRKGDLVVIVPEYHNFVNCQGNEELLMVISDIRPTDRSKLDGDQWMHLLQFTPEYGRRKLVKVLKNTIKYAFRAHVKKTDHDYGNYKYDERGDELNSRSETKPQDFKPYNLNLRDQLNVNENVCVKRIGQFVSVHKDATVVVFPAAVQDASFDSGTTYIAAVADMLEKNGTPFMAPPDRYRMLTAECWDSSYHLNALGIERRTRQLIEDLTPIIK